MVRHNHGTTRPLPIAPQGAIDNRNAQPDVPTLFRGFSVINGVREAKAEIYAGRADLLRSEQDILLAAVRAYMNVWRYQSFTRLRRLNLSALSEHVVATSERRRIGEATSTDVLQSKARRSRAAAQLSQTGADLKAAYAEFECVVDRQTSDLLRPRNANRLVPNALSEALKVALEESPLVLAAESRRSASRHALRKVRGELLPRADLDVSYLHSNRDNRTTDPVNGAAVTARVVVPLYQGGAVASRIREAAHVARQRDHQVEEARRQIRSDVKSVWSRLLSLKSQIRLNQARVDESRTALLGLLEQERRGRRTTTDALDAQQELTDAKIALVASETDLVIVAFNLMSTMGRLNAVDLGLRVDDWKPVGNWKPVGAAPRK